MERVVFYVLAAIMVVFAIASVTSRKMLRSVVYLLFVLCGIAGLYFLVDYNFLAAVQLTVYAGGIVVLVIFSVLLIHQIDSRLEIASKLRMFLAAVICLCGLALMLRTIYSTNFPVIENYKSTEVSEIGIGFLSYDAGGFILPFEVISVLLLAAMIGAIIVGKGSNLTKND